MSLDKTMHVYIENLGLASSRSPQMIKGSNRVQDGIRAKQIYDKSLEENIKISKSKPKSKLCGKYCN